MFVVVVAREGGLVPCRPACEAIDDAPHEMLF